MSRFDAVEEKQGVDQFGIPVVRHTVWDGDADKGGGIIAICPDRESALYVQAALEMLHEHQGSPAAEVEAPEAPAESWRPPSAVTWADTDGVVKFVPQKPWTDPEYMAWLGKTSWLDWQSAMLSNPEHKFCSEMSHAYNGPKDLCSKCGWDEVPF